MKNEKTFEAISKLKDVEMELHRLKNMLEITGKSLDAKSEWIDLSHEEIMQIWDKTIKYASTEIRIIDFARSILKAAQEKNT